MPIQRPWKRSQGRQKARHEKKAHLLALKGKAGVRKVRNGGKHG